MPIDVALHHATEYRYDQPVAIGPHIVRLRPAPNTRTPIAAYSLAIEPASHVLRWQQDPLGNHLARVVFPQKADRLVFTVDLRADMTVINPFDFLIEPAAETFPFAYDDALEAELVAFRRALPAGPMLAGYLATIERAPAPTLDFLVALNHRLMRDIRYLVRLEPGVRAPEETLVRGEGSCRDSAWLLAQILRHLGFASRFASGYLIQLIGDAAPFADLASLHAWCEVYLPGAGWIGLDPTSGLLAGEGHIPLACSPEPRNAAPISGTVEPSESVLNHRMTVARLAPTPRGGAG
jgi:transglutaminase-like putative cysteine protease